MPNQASSSFALGVSLLLLAAVSVQLGAAIGTSVIPVFGVLGIVTTRYLVQAVVHVPLAWRQLRNLSWRDWGPGVVVAATLLSMNSAIYLAFASMGVGLSVTIELLGPIVLAIVSARSWPGWVGASLAAAGMLLVANPTGNANVGGVFWAIVAATSWALYLVAARWAVTKLPGLVPSAMASLIGLAVLLPAVIVVGTPAAIDSRSALLAFAAGALSSALPYALDVIAFRRVPIVVASTLMSVNPALAVLWGWLILNERLGVAELAGLSLICAANILVVWAARTQNLRSEQVS